MISLFELLFERGELRFKIIEINVCDACCMFYEYTRGLRSIADLVIGALGLQEFVIRWFLLRCSIRMDASL